MSQLFTACWKPVLIKRRRTATVLYTALYFAAQRGHQAVAQCLLKACADKEKAMHTGATLLHFAALMGHSLEVGADKEKATNDGATPLHFAAQQGYQAIAQCLLEAGADNHRAHNYGATYYCILLHSRAIRQSSVACWKAELTQRRPPTTASHRCTLLHRRAIHQFDACRKPVLTTRRRPTMVSHHCKVLHRRAMRQLFNACRKLAPSGCGFQGIVYCRISWPSGSCSMLAGSQC